MNFTVQHNFNYLSFLSLFRTFLSTKAICEMVFLSLLILPSYMNCHPTIHLLTTVFKLKHVQTPYFYKKSQDIDRFTLRFAPEFPILHSLSIASVKLETSFFLVFKLYMLSLFLPIHILLPIPICRNIH